MTNTFCGKYPLLAQLGQGGMGVVYRSIHPQLQRPVAIKLIQGDLQQPELYQRFMREAQIVAGLVHPHIVRIFDVDVHEGKPYIVMDLVEGGSLADRLEHGPLTLAEALPILIPLVEALDYAHQQGIIHRDLKPANVLLHPDGRPVLADFGIARLLQETTAAQITTTGALIGTPACMAPEQFTSGKVDVRSDLYALGVLLFNVFTGQYPFAGTTAQIIHAHLYQAPPVPGTLAPGLPNALEQLILRMLAKNPDDRPQTASAVVTALRQIAADRSSTLATLPDQSNPQMQPVPVAPDTRSMGAIAGKPRSAGGCWRIGIGLLVPIMLLFIVVTIRTVRQMPDEFAELGISIPLLHRAEPTAPVPGAEITPLPWPQFSESARSIPTVPGATSVPNVATVANGTPVPDVTNPNGISESRLQPGVATGIPVPDVTSIPSATAMPSLATVVVPFSTPVATRTLPEQPLQRRADEPVLAAPQVVGPETFSVGNMTYGYAGGGLWFFGELRNDGPSARESVSVRITLFDETGKEQVSNTGSVQIGYLNPGEIAPFTVLFGSDRQPDVPPERYSIEVRSREADFQLNYTVRNISVGDEIAELRSFGSMILSGKVRNDNAEPVKFVRVQAVFYDVSDNVVGVSDVYVEPLAAGDTLAPDAEGRFELQGTILTTTPASYRIFAFASRE